EYLAPVVFHRPENGLQITYPDTVLGTDSHTTMINGLGVVGWGVGGIEAEAAMLGQPTVMLIPEVVGFRLEGRLAPGATATDVVLTVTEMLRKKGVVGKFVEFYGPGVAGLALADRATIGNMAPEYGATIGFFPIDAETLAYLRLSGRDPARVALVEAYARAQGLFRTADTPDPVFSDRLELDLGTVEPSLAGPRRPQDRVPPRAGREGRDALSHRREAHGRPRASRLPPGRLRVHHVYRSRNAGAARQRYLPPHRGTPGSRRCSGVRADAGRPAHAGNTDGGVREGGTGLRRARVAGRPRARLHRRPCHPPRGRPVGTGRPARAGRRPRRRRPRIAH